MGDWRPVAAAAFCAVLAACDEDTAQNASDSGSSGSDQVVDVVPAQVSTACLRELPEPSMQSDQQARLNLSFENFSYSFEEERHRFTHDRRFKESAGIGVHIYRGKVCVENGQVCADACVRYRIEPGGSLTQRSHHVATPIDPDRITLQYWARDDAGNLLTIDEEIRVEGQTARVSSN